MTTGADILKRAMSLLGEESKYSYWYTPFTVELLNQLLCDCFFQNNALRTSKGLPELEIALVIAAMETVIPYEEEMLRGVVPYGLAGLLMVQDEDYTKAGFFDARYQDYKMRYAPMQYEVKNGDI